MTKVLISLDDKILERLRKRAKNYGLNRSELIRYAIIEFLRRKPMKETSCKKLGSLDIRPHTLDSKRIGKIGSHRGHRSLGKVTSPIGVVEPDKNLTESEVK